MVVRQVGFDARKLAISASVFAEDTLHYSSVNQKVLKLLVEMFEAGGELGKITSGLLALENLHITPELKGSACPQKRWCWPSGWFTGTFPEAEDRMELSKLIEVCKILHEQTSGLLTVYPFLLPSELGSRCIIFN